MLASVFQWPGLSELTEQWGFRATEKDNTNSSFKVVIPSIVMQILQNCPERLQNLNIQILFIVLFWAGIA